MNRFLTAAFGVVLLAACRSAPEADPEAFRALGLLNASTELDGVYCSGQPTEEQFEGLAAAGITKVIHLRAADEQGTGWEEARAREHGIEFVRLPITGPDDVNAANARALAEELDAARGTVLVSCSSSNRVGALLAMKARVVDGKSPEEAMAIGTRCGMKALAPAVAEKLED